MPLVASRLSLDGMILLTPQRIVDSRGYFMETYNSRAYRSVGIDVEFRQDNQSLSTHAGTIRGLHFQCAPEPQSKLVRVIAGSIFDVAVDLRAGSSSYGRWCNAMLTAEGGEQLFIPAGFAHAFCTLVPDTLVAYKVDGFYNHAAEAGIKWDDPDIAINWPVPPSAVHVSDKDAALPYLRNAATPFVF